MSNPFPLDKDHLLEAYRLMKTIREFEERLHVDFGRGDIPGFVHLYAGEEAAAVGIMKHLHDQDRIASTHRGHGHCIAKGVDPKGMMAEIYGKATGVCAGKGGSMHIADLSKGMMGANGIVGGGPPLICGAALTAKTLKTGGIAIGFVGDGASNQGTTFESYNLAKVWNLPAVFIVEDNGYAESTASARAAGFDIPCIEADGHDFFAVWDAAREAIDHARSGKGPHMLHFKLNRYYGHFEGDALTYKAPDELDKIKATKDCLMLFKQRVTEAGLLDAAEMEAIEKESKSTIEACLVGAKAGEMPTKADLLTDVYNTYQA